MDLGSIALWYMFGRDGAVSYSLFGFSDDNDAIYIRVQSSEILFQAFQSIINWY